MTVSTSGIPPDNLPTGTDCAYGDTVQIDWEGGATFVIAEIAVVNMKGKDEKHIAPLCLEKISDYSIWSMIQIPIKIKFCHYQVYFFETLLLSDCNTYSSTVRDAILVPSLPVPHGTELVLSCPIDPGYVPVEGITTICQNGVVQEAVGQSLTCEWMGKLSRKSNSK